MRSAPAASPAKAIDELLFRPAAWLMLDSANGAIPGVRPGTLEQALALVGRGSIASFFGRLRPGVIAVDVDMARGAAPVMDLVAWCTERGLWHLVRASGRPGHHHVFVVAGTDQPALEEFCEELRSAYRVGSTRIQVRAAIRPLCAPHRSGATPPLPRLGAAARRLPKALRSLPTTPGQRDAPAVRRGQRVVADAPEPRRRRALPDTWDRYLRDGITPPQVANWSDQSRSGMEQTATFQMVSCGFTAEQAWMAITTSHPRAMSKARSRGRVWWTANVWNRAVADAAAQQSAEHAQQSPKRIGPPQPGEEINDAAEAVRAAFLHVWTRYGRDRRHTLRFVLDTLLDRMIRVGSTTVPCPERDLVLDTGLTSRRVIREVLHQLADEGWLVLHESFNPAMDAPGSRSHHVSLPQALPITPTFLPFSGPPSSFTPLPRALRTHLGPELTHLWLALPPASRPARRADLACPAGLCEPGGPPPTPSQLRTLSRRLQLLAGMGLAACDEHGHWIRLAAVSTKDEVVQAAKAAHARRVNTVSAERAEYELVRAHRGRWAKQREDALARQRTSRHLAAQRWWLGLHPGERAERAAVYQARFASLSLSEQKLLKATLAGRRAAAGVLSEDAVRRKWIDSLTPEVYTRRVIDRTMEFRALPPPLQAAKVAAWAEHRATWRISRDPAPLPHRDPVRPDPPRSHAAANEQLELLALADALDRDPEGRLAGISTQPRRPMRRGVTA